MRSLILIGCAVLLSGCATDDPPPVTILPVALCAPVEVEPVGPVLTNAEQVAIDTGLVKSVGVDLALAWIKHRDVSHPAWGRRNAERLAASRSALCPLPD